MTCDAGSLPTTSVRAATRAPACARGVACTCMHARVRTNARTHSLTSASTVYGEDIAVLAGDGLLSYAFEYIARYTKPSEVPAERILDVIARAGKCVGALGLVGGQVVDIQSEGKKEVTVETLQWIHEHKTAALLEFCVVGGGILGGANAEEVQRLSKFAINIGLAFQIIDDILDVTADSATLGKTAGKDLLVDKVRVRLNTYVLHACMLCTHVHVLRTCVWNRRPIPSSSAWKRRRSVPTT